MKYFLCINITHSMSPAEEDEKGKLNHDGPLVGRIQEGNSMMVRAVSYADARKILCKKGYTIARDKWVVIKMDSAFSVDFPEAYSIY